MPETLAILEKVNAFYSESFKQLITYTGAFLATVGVAWPVVVALFQSRTFKRDQEEQARNINAQITKQMTDAIAALEGQIASMLNEHQESIRQLEDRMRSEVARETARIDTRAHGTALHLQARFQHDREHYATALRDAVRAGICYAQCREERNLSAVFRLATAVAKKTDAEHWEFALENDFQKHFDEFLTVMEAEDLRHKYYVELTELKRALNDTRRRAAAGGTTEEGANDDDDGGGE